MPQGIKKPSSSESVIYIRQDEMRAALEIIIHLLLNKNSIKIFSYESSIVEGIYNIFIINVTILVI